RPRPPCTISAEAVHHSSGGDAPSSAVKLHFLSGVRNSFQRISRRAKIDVFDDEPTGYEQPEQIQYILPKKKKVGLFTALAAFAAGSVLAGRGRKKHDGHCDGDCANCPPHYGYRYGRWYYGKGHQYGCEFGGNKGDGSL
ncbi:hypothetical protein, partial [Flavonifractor sp. An82]|uniref:hypothetical protein n=1 Tax=Flavonifractor sp. An82 TaxID=1965660 RepID=UPI0031BA3947